MRKSLFGLNENIVAALAYAGFFVSGILVLLLEKDNKTLRFHGLQSTILFGALFLVSMIVGWIFGWIPFLGGLITFIPGAVIFICWLGLTLLAFKGITFKVPILGDKCWEHIHKE